MTDAKNDLDAVFREFREALAREVREDDASTHFDLGIAYAEIGMLADAASEFELVLKHDPRHVRARAELEIVRAKLAKP
jgi:Flp pilus assembly protein TadD